MQHLASLRDDFNAGIEPTEIRKLVGPFLELLMSQEYSWIFNTPVDPFKLNLPDYFEIVKKPMDLGTIKKRLEGDYYRTFKAFFEDTRQVWHNALVYNSPGSEVHTIATRMSEYFDLNWPRYNKVWQTLFQKRKEEGVDRDNNLCSLCTGKRFKLEPVTLYCNQCSLRLRKGVLYYTNKSKKYHWCQPCFQALPKGAEVLVDDQLLPYKCVGAARLRGPRRSAPRLTTPPSHPPTTRELERKRNDSDEDEPWVQCDHCLKWQHQICALYNARRNEGAGLPHYCAHCYLGHMSAKKTTAPLAKPVLRARDLRRCRLSDLIEARLAALLESQRDALAAEQLVARDAVDMPQFTVRVVSCCDKSFLVGPEVGARYGPLGFLPQQNYRSKAVVLFQTICSVDTLLFAVYWQEYGDDCGEPNRRVAYLSYLDSVKYLDPSFLRTDVYHEILGAYLADLRDRGFNQVNLWSCPPQKGDDYILSCHPEEQKTPRAEMLREWYIALLEDCQRRGVVERVAFLADDFFPSICGSEGGADRPLTRLPYFEGAWRGCETAHETSRVRGGNQPSPHPPSPSPASRRLLHVAARGRDQAPARRGALEPVRHRGVARQRCRGGSVARKRHGRCSGVSGRGWV